MRGHGRTASTAYEPVLAGYLALGMGVGPLTHYALSALGPLVVSDLGLSATEFGGLWLVAFGTAAASTPGFGRLTDHLGAQRMLRLTFVCAGAAMVAVSMSHSLVPLVLGVGLAGMAVATSNPATNLAVAGTVTVGRQGLVVGAKQSGVQASQLLAGLALPGLAVMLGWRVAILLCGVLAVLGFAATRWVVGPAAPRAARAGVPRAAMDPSVWWLTIYALVTGAAIQATNVYLPLYAHDVLGHSVSEAGLVSATLGGTGVLARLVWGRVMDRILDTPSLLTGLAVLTGVGLAVCGLAAAVSGLMVWVGAAIFGASALAANVVIMMTVVRNAPSGSVGRATGWTSLGLYAGFMVGPLTFGMFVDSPAGYGGAWSYLCALTVVLVVITACWKRFGRRGHDASGSEAARVGADGTRGAA
ncbi:MFS transporter [Micromonospora sp. NPDC023737]|uniref:MFS transporter n=1 Tax=unclassified Micromonospora TaxID=2617518 RepID=UPI0033DEF8E4